MQAPAAESVHALQCRFLAILPEIEAHARAAFRVIRGTHDRDDAVAEVIARAWELFVNAPTSTADRLVLPVIIDVRDQLAQAATAAC